MQNNTVQAAAQQEKEALMSVRLLSLPWGDAGWGGARGAQRCAGEFPIRVTHSQWWLPFFSAPCAARLLDRHPGSRPVSGAGGPADGAPDVYRRRRVSAWQRQGVAQL